MQADSEKVAMDGPRILGVSELTSGIKEALDVNFPDVCVQGEISQYTRAASGHVYMTLKDERAVLKAILWRSVAQRTEFGLEEGLEVICRGSVDVYPPRGSYQLIVRDIHPCGMGSLQLAYKQLLDRLEREGLFAKSHKKPLPAFPAKIGIITSETGAAVRDMIRIIRRRWPPATLFLLPTPVQGREAAVRIAEAIAFLNEKCPELDVIIAGRGGGSLEDLWPFNEECVARAIFASRIPVVSAVGHEVDFSVSDFVADLRAATPSEAAENTVPDRFEVLAGADQLAKRLCRALAGRAQAGRQQLEALGSRHVFRHPESMLHDRNLRLDELNDCMNSAVSRFRENKAQRVESLKDRLSALSPLSVLERGYSITLDPDGKPVTDAESLSDGESIETLLRRGRISSRVEK